MDGRIKVLCLVTVVIFASHIANAAISKIGAIKSGLKGGLVLTAALSKGDFSGSMTELGTSLRPFLSALGPLALIVLTGDSPELAYMKKEFEKVNNKLDRLNSKFDEVTRAIGWYSVKCSYGDYVRTIKATEKNLNRIYNNEGDSRETERKSFIKKYDSHFDNSLQKLYDGVMESDTFSDNILWAAAKKTKYHKSEVEKFSLGLIQVLIRGIKVRISYYGMTNSSPEHIEGVVNEWDEKMIKLRTRLQTVISGIKSRYQSQAKDDIEEILTHNYRMDNYDLMMKIDKFLEEKFDWRYWFVAVYADVSGYDRHAMGYCGGFIFLHFKDKKNVVVSSKDKTSPNFNVEDAKKLLNDVTHDVTHCSKATRDPKDRAKTIRDLITKKSGGGCRPYAMELVVETGNGLWYISYNRHRVFAKIDERKTCCWDEWKRGWLGRFSITKCRKDVEWSLNIILFG